MSLVTGSGKTVVSLSLDQQRQIQDFESDYQDAYRRMTSARNFKEKILEDIAKTANCPRGDKRDWQLDESGKFLVVW